MNVNALDPTERGELMGAEKEMPLEQGPWRGSKGGPQCLGRSGFTYKTDVSARGTEGHQAHRHKGLNTRCCGGLLLEHVNGLFIFPVIKEQGVHSGVMMDEGAGGNLGKRRSFLIVA